MTTNSTQSTTDHVLEIILPGVKREDIELQFERDQLRLQARGFRPELQAGERELAREFAWGDFAATLQLPRDVDPARIQARFDQGVLTLELGLRQGTQTRIPVN